MKAIIINKNDKIVCPAHILLPNAILSELSQLYRVYRAGGRDCETCANLANPK